MFDLHEIEEQEFARGPHLWDATPGVCCAAFQLGACAHTEAAADEAHDEEADDGFDAWAAAQGMPATRFAAGEEVIVDDEPF